MAGIADVRLARAWRAEGRSCRSIAAELGKSPTTIRRWTDPAVAAKEQQRAARWRLENNADIRAYMRAYNRRRPTLPCAYCGAGMPRQRDGSMGCRDCQRSRRISRWQRIQRLWNQGYTSRRIAVVLETTQRTVEAELVRMRREGWAILRGKPTQRIAAGEPAQRAI